jgi:hypothetical protein
VERIYFARGFYRHLPPTPGGIRAVQAMRKAGLGVWIWLACIVKPAVVTLYRCECLGNGLPVPGPLIAFGIEEQHVMDAAETVARPSGLASGAR